jgi:hypothetical protein
MIMSDELEDGSSLVPLVNFDDNPVVDCLLTLLVDSLFSNMYVTIHSRYLITLALPCRHVFWL